MAALISQDEVMLDCFERLIDLHKMTATEAFGTSIENVTKEQRTLAKTANFSIIYDISPRALAVKLKSSVEVAQILINGFNKKYRGFHKWFGQQEQYVKKYSQATSLFGHVRHLPEVRSQDDGIRRGAVRQGVNFPIQCTTSNMAIYAGYAIQKRLTREGLRAYTYNQVHDSVWFACHKDDLHKTVGLMKGVAENMPFDILKGGHPDYPRGVKMLVDFKVGPNMRDLEEYHAAVRQ
jgi:DNA polymerase-1